MLESWARVTLRGALVGVAGPERGLLEFAPTATLVDPGAAFAVLATPLLVRLDDNGFFSVNLLATDNPTKTGVDWSWKMSVRTENIKAVRYLKLPSTVPVVDYADLGEDAT